METFTCHSRREQAVKRMRERQRVAPANVLVAVEFNSWLEPWPYRVVGFDLSDDRDRGNLGPVGTVRVRGVTRVMFARRLALIVGPPRPARPAPPDVLGEYRAKRAAKRRRKAAA